MAQNILDISLLSPVKFRPKGYVNPAPYNFNFLDEHLFQETIPDFFEKKKYYQPWQKNDIIYIPFLSNYIPLQVTLVDCNGRYVDSFAATYVPTSIEGSGQKFYMVSMALNTYNEGVYQLLLDAGSPVIEQLESEWFQLKTKWNNTIKFQYKNNENDFDVPFEVPGLEFGFRIHGGLTKFQPGSDKTVFIDQTRNAVQLLSRSFYSYTLLIGDAGGVPDYMVQIVNEIFNCSNVLIDGKQFTAVDGKLSPVNDFRNPLSGWSMEVRDADKKSSRKFVTDGNGNVSSSVVYQIQTNPNGLGAITGPAGSNVLQITNIE
jgi:hypothetical protein